MFAPHPQEFGFNMLPWCVVGKRSPTPLQTLKQPKKAAASERSLVESQTVPHHIKIKKVKRKCSEETSTFNTTFVLLEVEGFFELPARNLNIIVE